VVDTIYATWEQLQAVLEGAPLTPERGQALLNETAARVDAALLAAGYTAPVTGAADLLLVGPQVVHVAAAAAHRELYEDQETPDRVTAWEAQFAAFLADVTAGRVRLPDQQIDRGGGLSVGHLTFTRGGLSDEWGSA